MIEKYFKNPPKQDVKQQGNNKEGNAKAGNAKAGNAKAGNAKGGDAKGKILQFLKKHWKMITIILIAAIAFMWAGPAVGAKFLIGPTIRQACKLIGGAKGGIIGTVAGIAGTAAAMSMGGDGDVDVDAGDVDSGDVDVDGDGDGDGDVDSGGDNSSSNDEDMDADDAEAQREMNELEQQGKEAGIDTTDSALQKIANSKFTSADQSNKFYGNLITKDGRTWIKQQLDSGKSPYELKKMLISPVNGIKNSGLLSRYKGMVDMAINAAKAGK